MILRAALLAMALHGPAAAQVVSDCDWRASLAALPEPWDSHTRTFANGAVRLAVSDVIEPAAGAFYMVVLSPPYDELGGRQCKVIGATPDTGFGLLDFGSLQASYDPAVGLLFRVDASVYQGDLGSFRDVVLNFSVNQATGEVRAGVQ